MLPDYTSGRIGHRCRREQKTKAFGADHPSTLKTLHNLAATYKADGRLGDAIRLFEEVRDRRTAQLGRDHPDTLITLENLALAYEATGQPDRAEAVLRDVLARREQKAGRATTAAAGTLHALGSVLVRRGRWADAEAPLRECVAVRVKQEPDAWTTFETKSVLGAALLGQQAYDRAEPLLLDGYEGLKRRRPKLPAGDTARLDEAVQRLVQLYDAWGKPDEVAKWRKELEKANASRQPEKPKEKSPGSGWFNTPTKITDCPAKSRVMSAPNSETRFAISARVISTFKSAMAFHIKLAEDYCRKIQVSIGIQPGGVRCCLAALKFVRRMLTGVSKR